MLKLLRWVLGRLILGINRLTLPKPIPRTDAERVALQEAVSGLVLYEFQACPFCVKVRRELHRLGIDLERRDARRVDAFRDQLVSGGGAYKVPCLHIAETASEPVWLYESDDIIDFLRKRYAPAGMVEAGN